MRNLIPLTTVGLTLSLVLAACGTGEPSSSRPVTGNGNVSGVLGSVKLDPAKLSTQDALKRSAAQELARAMTQPELRRTVKAEVSKRFDGDTNVLWSKLSSTQLLSGQTFAQGVQESALQGRLGAQSSSLSQLEQSNSKLQVALQTPLEDFSTEAGEVLVTYLPTDLDDERLEALEAFDSAGGVHWLSPLQPPAQTVLVIGENERVDEEGQLLPLMVQGDNGLLRPLNCPIDPEIPCGGGGGGGGGGNPDTTGARLETLVSINLIDDNEPWYKGKAELQLQINPLSSPAGTLYRTQFKQGEQNIGYNRSLFFWNPTSLGEYVTYQWLEKDGGATFEFSYSLSLVIRAVTQVFGFKFGGQDKDDDLGAAAVNFNEPSRNINLGDIEFVRR